MTNNLTNIQYIKDLAARHNFRFSKSLGQNFLVNPDILDQTLACCKPDPETGVLEIGPGIGTLTAALASRAGKVAAIEIDRTLIPVLEETVGGLGNVHITQKDALKLDLFEFCNAHLPFPRRIVCANLPYYITAAAVEKLLSSQLFDSVTLMLQYEAAKRICSAPGDPSYCALAAVADFYAERRIAFTVPADCFYPQPGVGSALLFLKTRLLSPSIDARYTVRLIQAAFSQRRKTMANALANAGICARDLAEEALLSCGFSQNARAELLTAEDFAKIGAYIQKKREQDKNRL